MPDLKVVAVLTAKPGSESIVRGALESLVAPTLEEPGCLGYELYTSTTDPTVFVTVELWKAQADLDNHMKSAHIAKVVEVAGPHFGAAPAIHPLDPIVV